MATARNLGRAVKPCIRPADQWDWEGATGEESLIDPDLLTLAAVFGVMSLLIMVAALRGRLTRRENRWRRDDRPPDHLTDHDAPV